MEIETLTLAGIAAAIVIAFCLSRHLIVRDKWFIEKNINDGNDFREYVRSFLANACQIRSALRTNLARASDSLHGVKISHEAAELSIRHIETLLVEQCKLGFVTSGSELDVVLRQRFLERDEASFIKSQHTVHVNVEKVRDRIFEMQRLSKEIGDWMPYRAFHIQEACSSLIRNLEREAKLAWDETDRILCDADREPAGIGDERVSPKVIEFRKKLAQLRSKIRTSLAAEAQR